MIVQYGSRRVMINVPNKCGITSCVNIAARPWTDGPRNSKVEARRRMGKSLLYEPMHYPIPRRVSVDVAIAVVRDPLERVISAYGDRVLTKRRIDPISFPEFCDSFEENRSRSADIHLHTLPQHHSLVNLDLYDVVFWTHQINDGYRDMIGKLCGVTSPPLHLNVSRKGEHVLTPEHESFFRDFYRQDYDMLRTGKCN